MATEVVHVVDPDMGSGYDYDSLYDWEAGEQGDLTGVRNEIAVAKCRCTGGTADSTAVLVDGWTTSATQYVKIWTDPAESYRHDGTYQTGNKYRLALSRADGFLLESTESYTQVIGLQIYNTTTSTGDYHPGLIRLAGSGTAGFYCHLVFLEAPDLLETIQKGVR
jgi:hypothetical protein